MRNSSVNLFINMIRYSFVAVMIVSALTACVVKPEDQALYDHSLAISSQGQKEQAYENIKGLCAKYPQDKKFCEEAAVLKNELYSENISFVKSKLDAAAPLSVSVLQAAEEKLQKASLYASTSETSQYSTKLAGHKNATSKALADAESGAEVFAAEKNYFAAYESVDAAKALNPAAMVPLAEKYSKLAVDTYTPEAEKLLAEDNLREAKELLKKMLAVAPDNAALKGYLEQAEANDTPAYYITRGNEIRDNGELENALGYYKKALAFPEARQEAQAHIDETRAQLIEVAFMKGVEFASQELNKQAYDNFMAAFSTMKSVPLELRTMIAIPKEELEQYYDNMFFLGQKAMDEGKFGQSYLYFSMLYDLVPSYHGLRAVKKTVEDKIIARALKSIAVIPFKSPVNEPELGLQVTSNIMQILQNALMDDVKIIERGALEVLLREYELAVAGSVTEKQAGTDSFQIKSADYLLMGEVLDSRTETNVQNSKKKVRVMVSEEKIRNIEWEDWAKEAEQLRKENQPVPPEPEKYIMKPKYEYAEYDVAFHEKVSYLSISYRVVETAQGRVTYSNTVRAQKEARDEATSGIDIGNYKIDMKAADLPTDIELSNMVRKETIDKISEQVMELFKDQDEKYLANAEKLESSNNLPEAVEMYVNAILLKIRKKQDVAELTDKAGKYLDVLSVY